MDFGALLHVAQKNSENVQNNNNKFYSTKFAPPKKESKVEKKLSDNIKKFLEKKEKEERERARAEKEKLNKLVSMRDEKSKNKIRKMLKVTKSANRSVLDDVENNTSVTEDRLAQPDEDDYGYVSNAAAELFKKYVDKVGQIPDEKKFTACRPATIKNLSSTVDRVKAAILKDKEDKGKSKCSNNSSITNVSNKQHSLSKSSDDHGRKSRDIYDPQSEKEREERLKDEQNKKTKQKSNRPPPPPIDFQQLLKLAEKKQFEPLEIKTEEKKKDPERLLTKKERQEMEERKKYFEEKERRKKQAEASISSTAKTNSGQLNGKIPKLNIPSNSIPKQNTKNLLKPKSASNLSLNGPSDVKESQSKIIKESTALTKTIHKNKSSSPNNSSHSNNTSVSNKNPYKSVSTNEVKKTSNSSVPSNNKPNSNKDIQLKEKTIQQKDIKSRDFPPKDIQKTREFPPKDIQKTRQFPPLDVKRSKPEKKPIKRRILDDDDDEYDSELDDFIDDGPLDEYAGGYSKYIKEIFGYDKSRYRDDDLDDSAMESSFAQQMREETLSKKIGLMEDLEDMKKEAQDKKLKMQRMKKMRCK